ncbi:hypothetical protein L210DRAFT_3519008 [Boletus edulis BED1]|uniref:Secreted protein n=1 Tax=Boletus edulis BED1 TaxID=1328754 RepID=A0AAD4GMC3_BOLED|nr:hypothetical protein L210DRAFT_3519008 [Boletus edulis BED1]
MWPSRVLTFGTPAFCVATLFQPNQNEFDCKFGCRNQETSRGLNNSAAFQVGRQSSFRLLTLSCQRHHGTFPLPTPAQTQHPAAANVGGSLSLSRS